MRGTSTFKPWLNAQRLSPRQNLIFKPLCRALISDAEIAQCNHQIVDDPCCCGVLDFELSQR